MFCLRTLLAQDLMAFMHGISKMVCLKLPNQKSISRHKNYSILYIGIAPSRLTSKSNIRKRIFNHFRGTAYGSTLRLSLGVLLSNKSKFILRRIKK